MNVVRVEHTVPDFDAWKQAFDSDPVGRERAGVRRYRIMRDSGDRNYVLIDLEFDGAREAEAFLAALHELWGRVNVMRDPKGRVVEVVESEVLPAVAGPA